MSDLENNNDVTPCTSEDCSGCEGCGTDEEATVTLTLDDGTVQECAVLTIFPVDDKQYIALLPLDENGENDDGEVYIYRFQEVNGEPSLDNIMDDDEYERVADAFDELLDDSEYDELVDADDEN